MQSPSEEARTARIVFTDLGRMGRRVLHALFDRGFRRFTLADSRAVTVDEIVGDAWLGPDDVGRSRSQVLTARLIDQGAEIDEIVGPPSAPAPTNPAQPAPSSPQQAMKQAMQAQAQAMQQALQQAAGNQAAQQQIMQAMQARAAQMMQSMQAGQGPSQGSPAQAPSTPPPEPWKFEDLDAAALVICACDAPQRERLLQINHACLEAKLPLLSGLALGWFGIAGPTTRGGESPCLLCMDLRITATMGRSCLASPIPAQPHAIDLVSKALIDEVGHFFGEGPRLDDEILFYDQHGSETAHPLLRSSRCPACGAVGELFPYAKEERLDLDASAEGPSILDLEDRLVSSMTGPLRLIQSFPVTAADPPAEQWTATVTDVGRLSLANPMVQSGATDLDADVARAAALGEAVERMASALAHPPSCFGSTFDEISDRALDPLVWDLFHEKTRAKSDFPFKKAVRDQPMSWLWADSLTEGRPKAIPVSRVFAFFQSPAPADHFDFSLVSGFATAPSLVDAAWHGLLEVLERDAFMLSWMNRLPMKRVEIDENSPQSIGEYVRAFRSKKIDVRLSTIELIDGVHLVVALGRSQQPGDPSSFLAAAADVDLANGCRRAIRELIAARIYVRSELQRARQQGRRLPRPVAEENTKMGDQGLLYAQPKMRKHLEFWWNPEETVVLPDAPADERSVREKLDALVAKLAEDDLEVLLVDLTPPEIRSTGLRITKTLVPGTYPMNFDCRFPHLGGRRMREVPVDRGFRETSPEFEDFQTIPHPFP